MRLVLTVAPQVLAPHDVHAFAMEREDHELITSWLIEASVVFKLLFGSIRIHD